MTRFSRQLETSLPERGPRAAYGLARATHRLSGPVRAGLVLAAWISVLFLSCGSGPARPQALDESTTVCEECRMSVKDSGYATQALFDDGSVLWFDDPGCWILWKKAHPEARVRADWVQDSDNHEWLGFREAFWLYAPDIASPMAYGIHAFKTSSRALAVNNAHQGSRIVTENKLLELVEGKAQ